MKIGVLSGTPVDTQMGAEYLAERGVESVRFACSKNPVEQNEMQILRPAALLALAIDGCRAMEAQGAAGIFLYCNSLAGAIDLAALRAALTVPVVTPLDVYRRCAGRYRRVAVLAANGQSLAAIEREILAANGQCTVFGAGILPLVSRIERGDPPQEIFHSFRLDALLASFSAIGCEGLILGCTHFPYIAPQLLQAADMEIIDPAEEMLALLRAEMR